MSFDMNFDTIPQEFQDLPWLQSILGLLQQQAKQIHKKNEFIQNQSEQIEALKQAVQILKDEIHHLKKMPKRPKFRPPGGNAKGRSGKPGNSSRGKGGDMNRNRPKKKREEIFVKAKNIPKGSKFKGYQKYVVQDIELVAKEIVYKLEVWEAPDGSSIKGALPKGQQGAHFGCQLQALVHQLYSLGITQPALFKFMYESGIDISEGQIHNILMKQAEKYEQASEEILKAGLQEAPYIRTDDTGAKHQHKSGYCTHIGGKHFAYYKTSTSKSRENFLGILLQGRKGYSINDAFIWHLFQSGVEDDDLLNLFEGYKGKKYQNKKGLNRLLNHLGIENKKLRLQCLEAGLIGFISENLLKPGQVLLSDRAGQFAVFNHAGCWVHMERPLRKLKATTVEIEKELSFVRDKIWKIYDKLKAAALSQDAKSKKEVNRLYDELIKIETMSPEINQVIKSFANYRDEMLKALDCPGLPLHNNDSERDIRGVAKRRNISGSTKSEKGKIFRDALLTLQQTCARLEISFWGYLNNWFNKNPINLAQIIRDRTRADCST